MGSSERSALLFSMRQRANQQSHVARRGYLRHDDSRRVYAVLSVLRRENVMSKTMAMCMSRGGMKILYKCYQFGHGRRCADRNTDKCLTCKYAKAEMSAKDATRMANSYGRKGEDE